MFGDNRRKKAVSTASNQEKKDPARDITTESGTDVTGAGPDTQLVPAKPGDIVINKETVDAVGLKLLIRSAPIVVKRLWVLVQTLK